MSSRRFWVQSLHRLSDLYGNVSPPRFTATSDGGLTSLSAIRGNVGGMGIPVRVGPRQLTAVESPETTWRRLRSLRADPPPRAAADGDRAQVFRAALEQAEQLFRGAAAADYAVRPLLVFYGLSQGGRALAAVGDPDDNQWRLSGHGLKVPNLDQRPKVPALPVRLPELQVRESNSGSFPRLASVLGSGRWTADVSIAALWAAIPELRLMDMHGWEHPTVLEVDGGHGSPNGFSTMLHGLPSRAMASHSDAEIDGYLDSHYPSLAGHMLVKDAAPPQAEGQGTTVSINRLWRFPSDRAWPTFLDQIGTTYRGKPWVFPNVGGATTHPLLLWWALLYALSMRARYEPESWMSDLDVNETLWTVQLEEALDRAVDVVPLLLLNAILEV